MKRSATLSACVVAALAAGCASNWKARSDVQATIYAEVLEIPVLWADSTFVGEVDGAAIERGKGYVLVDPGPRVFTVFHVNCPLPIVAVFCLRANSKREIVSIVRAGSAYRIDRDSLIEVRKDGQSIEMPSNQSLERTRER
jgi:hypothetical protein